MAGRYKKGDISVNFQDIFMIFVLKPEMSAIQTLPIYGGFWHGGSHILFVATRMSVDTSEWSTFKFVYSCLTWEDWSSLILPIHISRQNSYKEFSNSIHALVL